VIVADVHLKKPKKTMKMSENEVSPEEENTGRTIDGEPPLATLHAHFSDISG
jgi:hypothetical protein